MANRIPPHSVDVERSILGAILLDNEAMSPAVEIVRDATVFYVPKHRHIFNAMLALYESAEPIDLITVKESLKSNDGAGDINTEYLAELMDHAATSANIRSHGKIVTNKSLLRKLISVCTEAIAQAFEDTDEAMEIVDSAETAILSIAEEQIRGDILKAPQLVKAGVAALEQAYHRKMMVTGIPSGFTDLDALTAGFQRGDLNIVAGRPSMGKTSLAMNIVQNVCNQNTGAVVLVFSLEMSAEQLTMRMISSEANLASGQMRTGFFGKAKWSEIHLAAGRMHDWSLHVDPTPSLSALEIRAKCRRVLSENKRLDLVVIDYLTLMKSHRQGDNRAQEIGEITRALKHIAKELNVPIILIAQLSRKTDDRGGDRKPQLSDMRDSGRIEEDADVVFLVYREEFYRPEKPDTQGTAEIIVAKNRNGATGVARLMFRKEITRFENLAMENAL